MSGKGASGVSRSAAGGDDGRGDSEPKTKKQRLADQASMAEHQNETDEELYQNAVSMVFGGDLYSNLLGYVGAEGIAHLRGDRKWRKAMDALPPDELQALKLFSVPRPSTVDLSILRKLLTEPVSESPGKESLGWTFNDIAWSVLVASPLTSNKVFERMAIVDACKDLLPSIAWKRHTSSLALKKVLQVGDSSVFEPIARHPNATSEILSAVLLRVSNCDSLSVSTTHERLYELIASHLNTGELDLLFLSKMEYVSVRTAVSKNIKLPEHMLRALVTDDVASVRAGVALNRSTPRSLLIKLGMDPSADVRAAVARNRSAPLSLLQNLSADSEKVVLQSLAQNPNSDKNVISALVSSGQESIFPFLATREDVLVDELFRVSEKKHRAVLAKHSTDSAVISSLVEMDGGAYAFIIARNTNAPPSVLETLTTSESPGAREAIAQNTNARASTLAKLFTEETFQFKFYLSQNPSLPEQLLGSLAGDENASIRMNVASNESTPLEILRSMIAHESDENVKACIWGNRKIAFAELVHQVEDSLKKNGSLPDGLESAFWEGVYKAKPYQISQTLLVALSLCKNTWSRYEAVTAGWMNRKLPALPVRDIIRLSRDREIIDEYDDDYLETNTVVAVAVDKLSYFLSKSCVGSYSLVVASFSAR